jgi:hypothetical protein
MGAVTAAVVGGAIMAGGSYMASKEAAKGAKAQANAANAALRAFEGIPIPTIEEQSIILQNPDLVGQYSPEQVQAMELNVSAMQDVNADPETIAKQNQALQGISEVAEGGYTEADKSVAREINREVNQQSQARQKAILNSMASRGVLGSGMELAAQLQGEQQSIDQASRAGENLTQQAQARALQALGQQGSLAGQMRSQDFSEQSDKARAQDAIAEFNLRNRQNMTNQNVAERNRAQLLNLQQRQSLEDQRASLANQQQMHNKALIQTQFANRRGQAHDVSGAQMGVANAQAAAANARAAGIQGIAQGVGTAVGGIGSFYQSEQDQANAVKLKQTPKG